jgi:predicted TIM-barrel fold metal-dependent hydrolase
MTPSAVPADEPALEPELPIVDAHHHLWENHAPLAHYVRDYMAPQLVADAQGHNVVATVYMECQCGYRQDGPEALRPVGETEYAVAAGGRYGSTEVCAAVVGYADLMLGEAVGEVLDAHIAAGAGRFRGVRNMVTFSDDPDLPAAYSQAPRGRLLEPAMQAGARELARRGLSFDIWLFQDQLADLCAFADRAPELTIVLNHIGGYLAVGSDGKSSFDRWRAGLAEAARRPNVVLKIGGVGMGMISPEFVSRADKPGSAEMAERWRPLFETCVETFGAERCMLESNFPVDRLAGSYRNFWNAFKRLASGASESEKAALFSRTAARVYKLPTRA